MRIFLIILLILLLLTVIVCVSSIAADLRFWDGKFTWSVSYFGMRLLPRSKSDQPGKVRKKKEKPEKEEKEKELKKRFLMDKLWSMMQDIAGKMDLAGSGIAALPGPLQMMCRAVTWSEIETDIVIGGEDAADTARQYGLVQAGVQTVIDASRHIIRVRRKDVRIGCDFTADESRWNAACRIKIQIGTMLGAFIWLGVKFLIDRRRASKTLVSDVI